MINPLGHIFPHHLLMARFLVSLKLTPFMLWVQSTKLICVIYFALTECQVQTNNLIWKIVNDCFGKLQLFLFQGCLNYTSSDNKHIDPNVFGPQKQISQKYQYLNLKYGSIVRHSLPFGRRFSESVNVFMRIIVHDQTKSLVCSCQSPPHDAIAGFLELSEFF